MLVHTLKQNALETLQRLPDDADIEEIMTAYMQEAIAVNKICFLL